MKTKEISRKNMYIFMLVSSVIFISALIGIFYIKNVYAKDSEELENSQEVSTYTNIKISNAASANLDEIISKNNSTERKTQ